MKSLTLRTFALLALFVGGPLLAGWKLDGGQVHFQSVKNNNAAVPGTFKVSGGAENGRFKVTVDLNSLDTGLPPRDTNIKTALFEVAQHPNFVLEGAFPADALPKNVGDATKVDFVAKLHYRGLTPEITFPMTLVRTGKNTVSATTQHSVAVGLADLGLAEGPLQAMMKLCAHQSILPIAFVSFQGEWKAD